MKRPTTPTPSPVRGAPALPPALYRSGGFEALRRPVSRLDAELLVGLKTERPRSRSTPSSARRASAGSSARWLPPRCIGCSRAKAFSTNAPASPSPSTGDACSNLAMLRRLLRTATKSWSMSRPKCLRSSTLAPGSQRERGKSSASSGRFAPPGSKSSTAPPLRPRPPGGCAAMPELFLSWTVRTANRSASGGVPAAPRARAAPVRDAKAKEKNGTPRTCEPRPRMPFPRLHRHSPAPRPSRQALGQRRRDLARQPHPALPKWTPRPPVRAAPDHRAATPTRHGRAHRLVHEGGFDVQRLDDGAFRFTNPHGLTIRPPKRPETSSPDTTSGAISNATTDNSTCSTTTTSSSESPAPPRSPASGALANPSSPQPP